MWYSKCPITTIDAISTLLYLYSWFTTTMMNDYMRGAWGELRDLLKTATVMSQTLRMPGEDLILNVEMWACSRLPVRKLSLLRSNSLTLLVLREYFHHTTMTEMIWTLNPASWMPISPTPLKTSWQNYSRTTLPQTATPHRFRIS